MYVTFASLLRTMTIDLVSLHLQSLYLRSTLEILALLMFRLAHPSAPILNDIWGNIRRFVGNWSSCWEHYSSITFTEPL